ncbi:MAG TPA: hypothetical protein PKY93_05150 [Methanothrix sp.]|jgi:hypothetical protein|nr:hypothetical protein [Methanothrix sp.]HPC89697.1 hypothetical protein [Methanothrix sp.]HQI68536.1 hypothetical protein [Methanothrix sp.]HRS84996.1 hypothetical protein [Methanothrix sp.]
MEMNENLGRRQHGSAVLSLAALMLMLSLLCMDLIYPSQANFGSLKVSTNSTSWSIYRQSQNMSFEYTQLVEGAVSDVDYRGRTIKPSASIYQDLRANDVRLRARTAALPGNYSSAERISLQAYTPESIFIHLIKEAGNPISEIDYSEQWPVIFRSARWIDYDGRQINDREYAGNNLDYAGSSFLYSTRLIRESNTGMILRRMNASVSVATYTVNLSQINESMVSGQFMPSREMLYRLNARSTGIADLSYHIAGSSYDFVPGTYPAISEDEERYAGSFSIERSLYTRSDYIKLNDTDKEEDPYPCCFSGYNDTDMEYRMGLQKSARDVFDCSSFSGKK